jgi:hypothetical protein
MIASVFVRRLKEGRTLDEFIDEWEAERGYGVPTRVITAQSLEDPRDILSIGFVDVTAAELRQWLADDPGSDDERHERIETVIEATTFRGMFEVAAEHDFTDAPVRIEPGSAGSLVIGPRAD